MLSPACVADKIQRESRQFIDKTTHRHGFWRQFTDTTEDNSSTLFEDNSPTHLFEGNWQSQVIKGNYG